MLYLVRITLKYQISFNRLVACFPKIDPKSQASDVNEHHYPKRVTTMRSFWCRHCTGKLFSGCYNLGQFIQHFFDKGWQFCVSIQNTFLSRSGVFNTSESMCFPSSAGFLYLATTGNLVLHAKSVMLLQILGTK